MAGGGEVGDNAVLIRLGLLNGEAVVGKRILAKSFRRAEFRFGDDGWSFWLVVSFVAAALIAKEFSRVKSEQADRIKNYGYAPVTAGEIRAILDADGRPALRVVADAKDPAHILVCRARDYDKNQTDEIRKKLAAILGDVVIPE